ncbi:MAG: hypothetical protein ACOYBJ_03240 [Patescibacteria group bacterium]|jgi:hypothetical protein
MLERKSPPRLRVERLPDSTGVRITDLTDPNDPLVLTHADQRELIDLIHYFGRKSKTTDAERYYVGYARLSHANVHFTRTEDGGLLEWHRRSLDAQRFPHGFSHHDLELFLLDLEREYATP